MRSEKKGKKARPAVDECAINLCVELSILESVREEEIAQGVSVQEEGKRVAEAALFKSQKGGRVKESRVRDKR